MKKIFNLILCALCVLSYTSCNDDEGIEYTQVSPIKIISRDVNSRHQLRKAPLW